MSSCASAAEAAYAGTHGYPSPRLSSAEKAPHAEPLESPSCGAADWLRCFTNELCRDPGTAWAHLSCLGDRDLFSPCPADVPEISPVLRSDRAEDILPQGHQHRRLAKCTHQLCGGRGWRGILPGAI